MTAQTFVPTPELIQQASDLVVRVNAASVSLLQLHFRLDYQAARSLTIELEKTGIITSQGIDGFQGLTPYARSLRKTQNQPTVRELFKAWACDPFEGGDGGDAGSITSPTIWLFGIEHGDARNIEQDPDVTRDERDYSINKQLIYPFNRNAFKLFAAIHGELVEHYEQFARLHQLWVQGSKGYLKGNLYPYPCRNVKTWAAEAKQDTGFEDKRDLIKWCNEHRLPAIADAVRHYHPKLFIGIGSGMAREFSRACFGTDTPLETHQFSVNGHTKNIRYSAHNGRILVVLPHISSGSNGLNSDESLQITGNFIAGLMR